MAKEKALTRIPGVGPSNAKGLPGVAYCRAVNKSGGALTAGMVLVFDPTAANVGAGKPVPVTTTTTANHALPCGAVPAGSPSIPNGATFVMQIAGLHTALLVDGTTDLANGDPLSTFTTAGVAAKGSNSTAAGVRGRFAVYCDAAYTSDATTAAKKAFLTNQLGLIPD